ncbi:transposase [Mesorhizobium silamurunense]|uniref:transposase n=1 Tax=Mesorhizobium silamurunense TaxID=499528 RepID=UPI001FEE12B7|nr:transposase [Mesorhizobium silamurunense]
MDDIDQAIMRLIQADDNLKARFAILVSIPGISTVTAFTLIIEMPELGDLDEKAAASLCGLAPMSR